MSFLPTAACTRTPPLAGDIFEKFLHWKYQVLLPNSTEKVVTQQQFKISAAAVERLNVELIKATDYTVFLPTDSALEAVGITKEAVQKMDVKDIRKLLDYISVSSAVAGGVVEAPHPCTPDITSVPPHPTPQVAGYHPIPSGFAEGKPIDSTLKVNGKPAQLAGIRYEYKKADKGPAIGTAFITDGVGNTAQVVGPNWFSGRLTFHIVEKVLFPSKEAAAAMTAAAKAALGMPAASTAVAGAVAPKNPAGRKMLQWSDHGAGAWRSSSGRMQLCIA